ncbi:MAG: hypothetical protein WCQ60_02765 [bacterium]
MFSPSIKKTSVKKAVGAKSPAIADSLALIIDIESGLVRAALVAHVPGRAPHVLYVVTSPIISHATATHSGDLLGAMTKSLKEVSGIIANKAMPELRAKGITLPIAHIHCALSSPWIISKTTTVKVDYGKNVQVSKAIITKIVDHEHKELEKRFRTEHAAATADASVEYDLEFIEQKIFEIRLNGYPVTHIHGKPAHEIEVSFAVTVSSKDILKRIHDAIGSHLNIMSLRGIYGVNGDYVEMFHSSLLLQYAAFRNLVDVRGDYIAAHVHNNLSDIVVVRRGLCSILASFPFGMADFIKKSSAALNQSEPLAHSALSMRAHQHLTVESEKTVANASDPVVREWASQFFKTLASVAGAEGLPRLLVLSVHDHFPYFKQALQDQNDGISLDITALDEALLEKAVTYERGQDTNALVTMYAFALNPDYHADLY